MSAPDPIRVETGPGRTTVGNYDLARAIEALYRDEIPSGGVAERLESALSAPPSDEGEPALTMEPEPFDYTMTGGQNRSLNIPDVAPGQTTTIRNQRGVTVTIVEQPDPNPFDHPDVKRLVEAAKEMCDASWALHKSVRSLAGGIDAPPNFLFVGRECLNRADKAQDNLAAALTSIQENGEDNNAN